MKLPLSVEGEDVIRVRRPSESRSGRINGRVSEGTRTPDRLDHNQELYQLSYAHRAGS